MKTLIWAENFLPVVGGAEILISHLLKALADRGVEFEVVTSKIRSDQPDQESWNGIPIHRYAFHQALTGNISALTKIRSELLSLYRRFQPDLIHAHSTGPSLFLEWQTHRDFPLPRFLTVHAFFSYPPKEDGYLRKYLPALTYFNGVSRRMTDLTLALFSGKSPAHETIYNGLPSPIAPPNVAKGPHEIALVLSRLSPEKGIDLAIRAFGILRENHPQLRLWIAGEGPERKLLEQLVESLGLQEKVRFLGLIPPENVYETLAQASFLVMPSRLEEGLGLSALQAAYVGTPVIGARLGGLPELVRDDETGLLFEAENERHLAQAMERLLADPETRQNLGRRAQELAKAEFDFNAMVDAYERIYRTLKPSA